MKKFFKNLSKQFIILWGLISLYIFYFVYFTFEKHMNFLTGRYDLGNMDQTVWNTLHGNFFMLTNPDFNETMSRLSIHADFLLVLLAPFYLIWDDVRMLLLIQTVIIAFGAFFVYAIGEKILSQKTIPLALAFSYLINPYVNYQNNFDFHSVSLATTFILASFYFYLKKSYKLFSLFVVLTLITKEHMFFILGLFGLYQLIIKRKIWGGGLAVVGFLIGYFLISKFIPDARNASHFAVAYYSNLGDSPLNIIQKFFTDPLKVFSVAIDHGLFTYIAYVFMPVGYLSILSPFAFIFALPEFLINVLSNNTALRAYYYHYNAGIIPFVYISAIYGVRIVFPFFKKIKLTWIISAYIIFFSLFSAWYFGPLPGARESAYKQPIQLEIKEKISNYLNNIPQETSVAASNNLGAQLSHRKNLYNPHIASGIEKADLILIFVDYRNPESAKSDEGLVKKLLVDPDFYVDYYTVGYLYLYPDSYIDTSMGDFYAFKKNKNL